MNICFCIGLVLSVIYTISWLKSILIKEYLGIDIMKLCYNHRFTIVFTGFGFENLINKILISTMISFYLLFVWPWMIIGWIIYSWEF